MSYMGTIGAIMGGSGLAELWETVYAPNTVLHMTKGHAYARAHLLTAATLVTHVLDTPGCLTDINLNRLRTLHDMLLNSQCDAGIVLNEVPVVRITQIIDDLVQDVSGQSRTG